MDPSIKQILFWRVLLPVTATVAAVLIARKRGLPFKETFAWRLPRPVMWITWLPAWAVVIALEELLTRRLGLDTPTDWTGRSPMVLGLTGLGMVVVAPLSEELLFRGLVYSRLEGLRFGTPGAVLGSALAFGALHFQYSPAAMALVALDGVVFALARRYTRAVPLCFALHAMGNLYAYLERLPS
jgi:membrane protease YdiL (CAAX protease family)